MLILVINCGSSSAKYRLFDPVRPQKRSNGVDIKSGKAIVKGAIERIGEKGGICKNYSEAVGIIQKRLSSREISGIGHRVVHGGEDFSETVVITPGVLRSIERLKELAPLHNPPAIEAIKASSRCFRGIPQVAVFDTAFHQTIPSYAYIYGVPFRFYKKYKIRRYGFHGTSHRFVASEAAKRLKRPLRKLKLITAHLGNGSSMTAISRGKAVDTSMGFTPLEGLLMGTRSGDMDPAIVTFLMRKENLGLKEINDILNKKSGLLGISGISNDMRDILKAAKKGNARAALASKIFVYRIKKYIGSFAAVMGGLDAVIFTGGIGENTPEIKRGIARDLRPLLGRKVRFLTIPTNEEFLIARDTYKLIRRIK